jgi:hypothetical protein
LFRAQAEPCARRLRVDRDAAASHRRLDLRALVGRHRGEQRLGLLQRVAGRSEREAVLPQTGRLGLRAHAGGAQQQRGGQQGGLRRHRRSF